MSNVNSEFLLRLKPERSSRMNEMGRWQLSFAAVLALALSDTAAGQRETVSNGLSAAAYDAGALVLDDGRGFQPFWEAPGDNWAIEEAALARRHRGGDAWFRRHALPQSFAISFEWKAAVGATGGIGYGTDQMSWGIGVPSPSLPTACRRALQNGDGAWHRGRIEADAQAVRHYVDGREICRYRPAAVTLNKRAFLRLLDGEGRVLFRNLVVDGPKDGHFIVPRLGDREARIARLEQAKRLYLSDGGGTTQTGAAPTFSVERLGEDRLATYFRYSVSAPGQVDGLGLLIVPKTPEPVGGRPLTVALHGWGSSPEAALLPASNYGDMIRGPLRDGHLVLAPQMLTGSRLEAGYGPFIPPGELARLDTALSARGTSVSAKDIERVSSAITAVEARYRISTSRVSAIGLSAGGRWTVMLMAADPRIGAGVAAAGASAYDEEARGPGDFDIIAKVAPRPLLYQAGTHDAFQDANAASLARIFPGLKQLYGSQGVLEMAALPQGHEFEWEAAREFLDRAYRVKR